MTTTTHSFTEQQQLYKKTALNIGYYLAREAVWDGDRCNWIGHTVENVGGTYQVVRQSFTRDFYNGTSGIAYFLALLSKFEADEIIVDTLTGAMNQILSLDEETDKMTSNFGFHGGRIGTAFATIEAGKIRNEPSWTEAGFAMLDRICEADIQDFEFDIISGVAGGIPVLLQYYRETKRDRYLQAALKCGAFLLERAEKTETSWSWKASFSNYALTGYSHGNAGIALALLEIYQETKDPAYYTAAMYGFNYERLLYNPSVQNWPDLREMGKDGNQTPTYGDSWCHGAPGIALSRLRAWQLTGDNSFKQEAEIALGTTYKGVYSMLTQQKYVSNYSLCHGIAGNTDILLEGVRTLDLPVYQQVVEQVGDQGIEKYDNTGIVWPSGVNDPTGTTRGMAENPGFMLGLSGTGYFYLRLAYPSEVRSLLLL